MIRQWFRVTFVPASILVLACGLGAQRFIPPDRDPFGQGHLKLAAENLRGTHFYLSRNETVEAFWSRYWPNRPSIEFRMGQLARAGVNYLRLWSSYRAFLLSVFHGHYNQSLVRQTEPNGHWPLVKDFCDLANDYEIGVAVVLFNTFGFGSVPDNVYTGQVAGTPGSPRVNAFGDRHVEVRIHPAIVPPGDEDATKHAYAKLWVGNPDMYEGVGFVAEQYELFRHRTILLPSWLDGPTTDPNLANMCRAYLEKMTTAGVTTSKGLAEIQLFNEPEGLQTVDNGNHGLKWPDVCRRIHTHLNGSPNNPQNVPRHLATKGPRSLVYKKADGTYSSPSDPVYFLVAVQDGFDEAYPNPPYVEQLDHWNLHNTPDCYVRVTGDEGSEGFNTYAQFKYATTLETSTGGIGGTGSYVSFHYDLKNHPRFISPPPPNPVRSGSITQKGLVAEETTCRAGTLQRATDLAQHTVKFTNPRVPPRMGTVTWGHQGSDGPKVEFGPFLLPSGFSLSPFEDEAFNDNWRVDTTQPNPQEGVTGVEALDSQMSDSVQVAAAQSTDDRVILVVYADNFSYGTSHSAYIPVQGYARQNQIYYRVRYKDTSNNWQWYPPVNQSPVTLDTSTGPLLFAEGRKALASGSTDTDWVDLRYSQVAGYPAPTPPAFGDYFLVDHAAVYPIPAGYLRDDALNRQKRRNADCDLRPSVVFQKASGTKYRFFVAWSRPVGKSTQNPNEHYFPEEDPGQGYFVPFKNSFMPLPGGSTPAKYEVLVQDLVVNTADAPPDRVETQGPRVMRTRGELAESTPAGNTGNMASITLASHEVGAAAVHPRLFVEPASGHVVLVYMKSQDSWFDISGHPGGLWDGTQGSTNMATWEDASAWHVYPWELFAAVFIDRSTGGALGGDWIEMPDPGNPTNKVQGEWRVNDPYPNGGLAQWLLDHRIHLQFVFSTNPPRTNNPASPKGAWTAEYFPAVDPDATLWTETGGSVLRFAVAYKELSTWVDPTNWNHPHGHETKVASFTVNVSSSQQTQGQPSVLSRKRLRVPFTPSIPDDESSQTPWGYASFEAKYDMNEAPVARTPDFGGLGVTVMSQNGQRVAFNHDGYDAATQSERIINASPNQFMVSPTRIWSSSMKSAAVENGLGSDDVFVAAWLQFTAGTTPAVDLKVWARAGATQASTAVTIPPPPGVTFAGIDCQARLVSLVGTGPEGTGVNQAFAVTWHQAGWLLRRSFRVEVVSGGVVITPLTSGGQKLGHQDMFLSTAFLHSGKLKSAATKNAIAWSIKGWVNFLGF